MKVYILFFLFSIISTTAFSQIADTNFGESKKNVKQKVDNRFGYPDSEDDESIIYWDKAYAGHVWNYIRLDFKTDTNGLTHLYYNALSKDFSTLVSAKNFLINLKFELQYTFTQAEKEKNVFSSYKAKKDNKDIELYIYYNSGEAKKYAVWLAYTCDSIDYKEQDLNSSIMYTNFGDTYEDTKSILYSKYGLAEESEREGMLYSDVVFAGTKWDHAFFKFVYTSTTNHLTSIMLSKGCDSAEDAKSLRETILHEKINPNDWKVKTDDNGFKSYLVEKRDRYYVIIIERGDPEYPYWVRVAIYSTLYQAEDKL